MTGTWQYEVGLWLDQQNINWTNKIKGVHYIFQGKKKRYHPDFYLPQYDLYIQVKGYETDKDKRKWTQFKSKLLILRHQQIKKIKSRQIKFNELYSVN